jgi:LEA14-like dessication related protein
MEKRVFKRVSIALNTGGLAAVLLGAAVFLASCSSLQSILRGRIEKPRVSMVSAKVERLSFVEADLLFDIKIENPNRSGLKLAGLDYSLFIDEARFLEGVQDRNVAIEPRGDSNVQLPLTVRYEELFRAVARHVDEKSAKYRLELGLRFELPALGETRVPLSAEGEIPVLKTPSLGLASVRVSRLDFTEADLVLSFAVRNPNETPFILDRFDFRLEVGGQSWASGGTEKKASIGASGETLVQVPVRVSTFFIGQTGYRQLLETRPLSYKVSGIAVFSAPLMPPGGVDFPFDASGVVEVTR